MENKSSEWTMVSRQPRVPVMVPGLKYPKAVVEASKKCDKAYSVWVDAETAWMTAQEALSQARALDAQLFTEAILNGTEDPGEVNTPRAERKLKGAGILLNARLKDANRAGAVLAEVLKDNQREILLSALEVAEEGLRQQEMMMFESAKLASEAISVRNSALVGLREMSAYTRGTYQFDPSFPVEGNVSLPDVAELRVKKICADLRSLVDSGSLFPEDAPEVQVELEGSEPTA